MAWWEGAEELRVLIGPELAAQEGARHFLSLRHPKSGNTTCYLLVDEGLLEIHWFKQSYGSWFLGDYVCEDGRLYTATPVDPVFILLPIFEEARMKKGEDDGKFRQLDEIIYVDGYPAYRNLIDIADKQMPVVCDIKEIGSTKFFRLNDSKVLSWMCYKVHQLRLALPTLDKNYAGQSNRATLAEAVSILGEYLKEEPWLKFLCDKFKLNLHEGMKAPETNAPCSSESSLATFNAVQEKSGTSDKKTSKNGRVTKKAKVETDSKSIKDMFTRASRKGRQNASSL